MPKANRTCYCCGQEYYYCPSCPGDKKDPQIYTMWDSEVCKDIFNTLSRESLKKITTKECKENLIELGVDKIEIKKESVKNHINRVMSCEDIKDIKIEKTENVETEEVTEEPLDSDVYNVDIKATENIKVIENIPNVTTRKRKSYYKNKDNE